MKLKTTAILAVCGVLASAAGAFAIPVGPRSLAAAEKDRVETSPGTTRDGWSNKGARITAGDTLLVDARLGHASMPKGSQGETYLFAQVTASEEKVVGTTASPMNLAIVID